jgi:chemotaxis protein MotB
MKRISSVFLLILTAVLFFGCAHHYTEDEYQAVVNELHSCKQQEEASLKEKIRLDSILTEMEKKLEKTSSSITAGYSDKQELLDTNIQCMEENKTLLKQITRFKVILQERKDATGRINKANEFLLTFLKTERVNDQLYIIKSEDRVKIVIPQRVLFPTPLSAWLMPKSLPVIKKIAKGLDQLKPLDVEIAGYTDGSPITRNIMKTYQSQWDLGNARAVAVLLALENLGIKKDKLSSLSYGDTRPIADSTSEEGRSMNRRVEIIITP